MTSAVGDASRLQTDPSPCGIPSDRPTFENLAACVHCGLCLEACPTYRELHVEMDSPRGRLYLMKGILNDRIAPTETVLLHLDRCLECRACETACPSGVEYGPILEKTRTLLEPGRRRPVHVRLLRWLFFRVVLPSRRVQAFFFNMLWLQQAVGLAAAGRWLGRNGLLPGRLGAAAAQAPRVPFRSFRGAFRAAARGTGSPGGTGVPPLQGAVGPGGTGLRLAEAAEASAAQAGVPPLRGTRRHRVALFTGCIADFLFPEVNAAAVRVLTENGCEVDVLSGERCCGALHIHNGDREFAKGLARANVSAFAAGEYDFVVNTAAGCGAELRAYGELLGHDPAAVAFGKKVRDVAELLHEIGIVPPPAAPAGGVAPSTPAAEGGLRSGATRTQGRSRDGVRVAYDEPCHLLHAQRVSEAPKALLQAVPGIEIVPLDDADACCGSAGIYSLVQPDLAQAVLARKIDAIRRSGAEVVATGNPGCILQIRQGVREAGLAVEVLHPIELLARAYEAGDRLTQSVT